MRGVPQKRKKQMGLEKRMNRLLFSTMIPMACLLVILLLIFWQYAGQYNKLSENLAVSSKFNLSFKDELDLEMYYLAIGSKEASELDDVVGQVEDAQEIAGKGLKVTAGGHVIHAGNQSLMAELGLTVPTPEEAATVVYTAVDGVYSGYLLISDEVKEDAKEAISRLHHVGVKKTVMLTGDRKAIGEYTAKLLDLDEVHTDLLPADKVSYVNDYCNKKTKGRMVCFVGDGINDAPVLARADVGIAMGGLGSDAAVEAADIVIMEDQPSKLADVIQIGRRTVQICNQNIVFAIAVKVIILALVAAGFANMWAAVFADVGVAVIAILNAMRTLYYKPQK